MKRPNRPEQPSLVTKPYLDEKLRELEVKLLAAVARELDERFAERDARLDNIDRRIEGLENRFDKLEERLDRLEDRFDKLGDRLDLRLSRFEKSLAWQILGTLAGTIVATTAIFSAVVVIVGID